MCAASHRIIYNWNSKSTPQVSILTSKCDRKRPRERFHIILDVSILSLSLSLSLYFQSESFFLFTAQWIAATTHRNGTVRRRRLQTVSHICGYWVVYISNFSDMTAIGLMHNGSFMLRTSLTQVLYDDDRIILSSRLYSSHQNFCALLHASNKYIEECRFEDS